MIEVIYKQGENRVPIKSWVTGIESNALEQAKNLSNLPFVFKHIALMPDCHSGYGMPIGGVIATKGVIIPNAVGVDIGCGMCALKTSIKVEEFKLETLKQIMGEIRKAIPVGFDHNKVACPMEEMPSTLELGELKIVRQEFSSAMKQLGTLGGGNHFIEIQKGSDGYIWVMIHSGSRNIGLKVAEHYNKIAEELNEKWYSSVTKDKELAFLPANSQEGKNYLEEMNYCLQFAYANRLKMMEKIKSIIQTIVAGVVFENIINIHHNYVTIENHFGENVYVHRKGATSAKAGQIGIIPGSQGTCSYIVEGLGNTESFQSCSHGAGRKMGRKEAIRSLDLAAEQKMLNDKGILHAIRGKDDLEEAAGAYKNIDEVMENQKDLVKILIKLEPLGVIKG